jgi:hypothetical protein
LPTAAGAEEAYKAQRHAERERLSAALCEGLCKLDEDAPP